MHALNALFWKAVSDCLLPAVGMSLPAEEESDTSKDDPWPELEKAEKLARGAALKWASGVFYRPDQLQRLGHYCKRETQRMASIESRLKSVVHSYLEGVGLGLGQLCSALEDVRTVCHTMKEVRQDWQNTTAGFKNLERFRELVSEHMRLTTVMHHLPQVILVPQVVEETQQLIESRQLLEAHSKLMQLECWRDNTLYQMHHSGGLDPESKEVIMCHFSRVEQLSDALAKEIWDIVGHALNFVKQDPAVFVTAVRIIEREEKTDRLIQDDQNQHQLLLPGRPKNWRQKFFKVIEEIISVQFHVTYLDIKGLGLANHLESLQNHIMNNLTIVKHLMVQCCPPEYDIFSTFVLLHQKYLSRHLQDIVSWDLSKNEVFTILNWTLNVYHSPEMLGHPDLFPEVDAMNLEPLLSKEVLQKLENKYVSEVRASMSEWMQKALEAEVNDWFRDQEPDEDHEGYYQSSLPVIIMQILSENIHLASMICSSLTEQLLVMALNELEIFLRRFREALIDYEKDHLKDRSSPKHYTLYLLTAINSCLAFQFSISNFHRQYFEDGNNDMCHQPPSSLMSALELTTKKSCSLLMGELLYDVQPQFLYVFSQSWRMGSDLIDNVCMVLDHYCKCFGRVKEPIYQILLQECQHVVVVEYLRALMEKRMVCRNSEERSQFSDKMTQDSLQLNDFFCKMGLEKSEPIMNVIPLVSDLIRVTDTTLLSLQVSDLVMKYPDISDEHVSVLLDIRGDVTKETRMTVLELLQENSRTLPEGYQSVFSNILVPTPAMAFCIPAVKCT